MALKGRFGPGTTTRSLSCKHRDPIWELVHAPATPLRILLTGKAVEDRPKPSPIWETQKKLPSGRQPGQQPMVIVIIWNVNQHREVLFLPLSLLDPFLIPLPISRPLCLALIFKLVIQNYK